MRTAVIYYSYGGYTKRLAEQTAQQQGADLYEVRLKKRPHILAALIQAGLRKRPELEPLSVPFSQYERLLVMAPIWAGKPAPAIYPVLEQIPAGKEVILWTTSGSGSGGGETEIAALLEERGSKLVEHKALRATPERPQR